ncbi:hypothetical protein AB4331_05915 [Vibrio breoganii]
MSMTAAIASGVKNAGKWIAENPTESVVLGGTARKIGDEIFGSEPTTVWKSGNNQKSQQQLGGLFGHLSGL